MNIIIPMGGLESRFNSYGYRFPKPLINVVGRPIIMWLIDNLHLSPADTIFLAVSREYDQTFGLSDSLAKEYPWSFTTVHLPFSTRGPAETVYSVLHKMTPAQLARKTISLDCDTFYFSNILHTFRALPSHRGCCFYFHEPSTSPLFSYISLRPDASSPSSTTTSLVDQIAEKNPISTLANTGAYGFPSGEALKRALEITLAEGVPATGSYYLSDAIAQMMSEGIEFEGVHVKDFASVGSRAQLEEFFRKIKSRPYLVKKRRFCFDLDNCLVTYPVVKGDYSTVKPIEKTIQLVRELKAMGHTIIISTARRMRTHDGNVGAVIRDIGKVTFETLEKFNIPYDEFHFGKPWAQVYVDDLSVHSALDMEKELGWGLGKDSSAPKVDSIQPRHFNTVHFTDNTVIKSSNSSAIWGELYFYQHVPRDIEHLFPKLESFSVNTERKSVSFTLQRIPGVILTRIFTSRCLTPGRLKSFLNHLRLIHSSRGVYKAMDGEGDTVTDAKPAVDIYANYASKVRKRYISSSRLYASIGITHEFVQKVLAQLEDYEKERRALHVPVVHGDPVFTNVLSLPDGTFKFIDMRGSQGDIKTLEGDAVYDLGKVYQSICGYDLILEDLDDPSRTHLDAEIEQQLRRAFKEFLIEQYKEVQYRDVMVVAASLYLSLIPLHDNFDHQSKFAQKAISLFADAQRVD